MRIARVPGGWTTTTIAIVILVSVTLAALQAFESRALFALLASSVTGLSLLTLISLDKSGFKQSDADGSVLEKLNTSAGINAISAAEVSFSVDQLTRKLDRQVTAIAQIAATTEEISAGAHHNAAHAELAVQSATLSKETSTAGRQALVDAISSMQRINTQTASALAQIEALDEKVHKIQSVTESIASIARQTNLLALNAAIEAARAGEHGRGFAVVADEVRQLAALTSESTGQVADIVDEILTETRGVVSHIQTLSNDVDFGTKEVETVGGQLAGITDQAVALEEQISAIATNTQRNLGNLTQIVDSIADVRAGVTASEQEMERLASEAERLMELAEETNATLASASGHSYHNGFYLVASAAARKVGAAFEKAIAQGEINTDDLFDRHYEPIPGTNPQKFSTRYDRFCDKILPSIQEPAATQVAGGVFAITCDYNGYVPTHNARFAQPLTGDYDTDIAANRTKRLFDDRTGSRCGSHTQRMLLQTYKRDTGEIMHDLSVPIFVKGRHWGGFRIGYVPQTHGLNV